MKQVLNKERVKRRATYLTDVGERISGTKSLEDASKYIIEEISDLEGFIDRFPIYTSKILEECSLNINGHRFNALTDFFSLSGDLTGNLIYSRDLKEDLDGKIVLNDGNYSPSRPLKAKIASEKGALAIIFIGYGLEDSEIVYRGGIKYVWGNPGKDSVKEIPRIISINISRKDGNKLYKMLTRGEKLEVMIKTKVQNFWTNASQPTFSKKGNTEKFILLQSALEAIGHTATFNSAANASMMEIIQNLYDSVNGFKAIFTDGHEVAESAGSTFLLDSQWDIFNSNCIAYINMESLGVKGADRSVTAISPALKRYTVSVEKEHGFSSNFEWEKKAGEASGIHMGIPYYWHREYLSEAKARELGGSLGWWYRCPFDTMDMVEMDLLMKQTSLILDFSQGLMNCEIPPYSIQDYLIETKAFLESLKFSTNVIKNKVSRILESCIKIEKGLKDAEDIVNFQNYHSDGVKNEILGELIIKTVRSIHSNFLSVGGRYSQDPYGTNWQGKLFPYFIEIDENSNEGINDILKRLNRVSDAVDSIKTFTFLLKEIMV